MEHAIEVRPSCDGDRAAILRIAEQVFGAMPARTLRDEWTWQWQADPRLTRPGHVGVVAECDGRVIASTALQPAGLFRGGVPVEAWWSVNTMVDLGHRRRGIAAQLFAHLLAERAPAAVFGKGISAPALPMLSKCGFEIVDTGGYWHRTVDLAPRIARHTGKFVARALATVGHALRRRLPPTPPQVVEFEGDFDGRFDELWSQAVTSHTAITRRDAELLNWRYRRHPFKSFRVLQYLEAGQLRGYVVLHTYSRRGCLRARICDLLARHSQPDVSEALLAAAMQAARSAGCDRIDCFASDQQLRQCLDRLGFVPAHGQEPIAVHGATVDGLYITAGDGDGV